MSCDSGEPTVLLDDGLSHFTRLLGPLKEHIVGWQWVLAGDVFAFPAAWYRDFDKARDQPTGPELQQIEKHLVDEVLEPEQWRVVDNKTTTTARALSLEAESMTS